MMTALRLRLVVAALLLCAAPALAQRPPDGPRPFRWWKSDAFKKDLGLTADQSTRIDKIWEVNRVELRQEYDELSKWEAKFSKLLQGDADEATLTRMTDRVETSRASANKTRSLMLVQMLKVLTPEQRVRFGSLHEKWQHERTPQPPPSAPRRQDP